MKKTIIVIILMGLTWMHRAQLHITKPPVIANNFSCRTSVPPMPLRLHNLSGYWYESGRVPKRDIMKCLTIYVPKTAVKDLELYLEYISTIAGDIKHVKETLKFPMNNYTRNSVFQLFYNGGPLKLTVTYKIIYTDYIYMTILCGYSGISPIPLFKILSRQRKLDRMYKKFFDDQLSVSGLDGRFMWTQQSPAECSKAALCPTLGVSILMILAII